MTLTKKQLRVACVIWQREWVAAGKGEPYDIESLEYVDAVTNYLWDVLNRKPMAKG